jgi:hypothetical protein
MFTLQAQILTDCQWVLMFCESQIFSDFDFGEWKLPKGVCTESDKNKEWSLAAGEEFK